MNNTRFSTAIHIMTILGSEPEKWFTSDWLALSININPVIIRKELIELKEAGLIESKKGKDGGCKIKGNITDIKISDIYATVKNSEILGKKHQKPNPKCSVGKNINKNLDKLFLETDNLVMNFLSHKSLKEFIDLFE